MECEGLASREPPYDPTMISDYILCRGGGELDKLQVIKIATIAYGYVLAMTRKRLFREESRHGHTGPWYLPYTRR